MTSPVDSLMFWHPIYDRQLDADFFDWGNVARGSSADRRFRVRNASSQYTATDVVISMFEYGLPALSVAAQHFLSTDGLNFAASVDVGTLHPHATSAALVLRRVTAPDSDYGSLDMQLLAHATDWV